MTIREAAAGRNVRRDCRSADTAVTLGDPTMVGTTIVHMRDVVLPASGMYRLLLLGDGELIMERSILVALAATTG